MISRLREALRQFGWREGTLYLVGRALASATGGRCRLVRYALMVQPVQVDQRMLDRPGPIEIRELDGPAAERVSLIRPPAVIAFRFSQQARCFAAFRDHEVVGCIWVLAGAYREDEVDCVFDPQPAGEVGWDFDVYVHPRYRLGTLFSRLWAHANRYLAAAGCTASASRIDMTNRTSLNVHQRLGARCVGTATFLRLGNGQVALTSHPRRLHLGTGEDAPRIRVDANAPSVRLHGLVDAGASAMPPPR